MDKPLVQYDPSTFPTDITAAYLKRCGFETQEHDPRWQYLKARLIHEYSVGGFHHGQFFTLEVVITIDGHVCISKLNRHGDRVELNEGRHVRQRHLQCLCEGMGVLLKGE